MINYDAENARRELLGQGWTLVPDEGRTNPTRAKTVKGLNGQYLSYYEPEVGATVIVLYAKLREALGLTV